MSKKSNAVKTTVMRMLDKHHIPYEAHQFEFGPESTAVDMAKRLGRSPDEVFKTLVTVAGSGEHYVFVIPSDAQLDLKKAARAVGEKSVEMVRQKDLLALTGYIHGGCSPIGMKKQFATVFDRSLLHHDDIVFSAGQVGVMVSLPRARIEAALPYEIGDICAES